MTLAAEIRAVLEEVKQAGSLGREKLWNEVKDLRREQTEALSELHEDCLTPMKVDLGIIASKFKNGEVMTRVQCLELRNQNGGHSGQPPTGGKPSAPPGKSAVTIYVFAVGTIVMALVGVVTLIKNAITFIRSFGG